MEKFNYFVVFISMLAGVWTQRVMERNFDNNYGNNLDLHLIPPNPGMPRNVYNIRFPEQKHTRVPFIRNVKNYELVNYEHQTDWIPIPPPSIVMEEKHDRGKNINEVQKGNVLHNRRGKILINNNDLIQSQNIIPKESKHSFVFYQKLFNNNKRQTIDNTTYETNRLTEKKGPFENDEILKNIIQTKLDDFLKKFESNLSDILESAVSNMSQVNNKHYLQKKDEEIHLKDRYSSYKNPADISLVRQSIAPPTSGVSSPRFISPRHWRGPLTDAGYTTPPNLNRDSITGTLQYTTLQDVQQGTLDSTTHKSIQIKLPNNHVNQNYSNNNDNKLLLNPILHSTNKYNSDTEDSGKPNDYTAELNDGFDTNVRLYDPTDGNVSGESIQVEEKTFGQDSKVKRKIGESLLKLNEPLKTDGNISKRHSNIDEDGRPEETVSRDNRVTKRMYPFYTSVDLKGINTFHSGHNNNDLINNLKGISLLALDQFRREHKINLGYNSLDHSPPDPLVSLFLSHYGRYIPSPHTLGSHYRNIYSYLASNNIHNNKPFGSYKIYEDTDG